VLNNGSSLAVQDATSMAAMPQLTQQQARMMAPLSAGKLHEIPLHGQFLQPRMEMHSPMAAQPAESVAQMQAYNPFNAKKYETLSYLPSLGNMEIKKQVEYMIKNHWTPGLEISDDGDVYLNTRMGPGYYDNRYWSMYKLPMFGCTDSSQVLREIENAKSDFPNAKVRVIAFDSVRQVQTAGFIVKK